MQSLWTIPVIACLLCTTLVAPVAAEQGTKRALLICGLTGEDEFKEQFVSSLTQIHTALVDRLGFEASDVRVHYGAGIDDTAPEQFSDAGGATLEEITAEAEFLVENAKAEDVTWVFLLGHAYFDGKTSFFNIPDRDLTHQRFGKLFKGLKGQAAFFICTPASGYYIKGLSQPKRVVVTATDADYETNASLFHIALAQAMTEFTQDAAADLDKNGTVSLLDVYIKATQHLADFYLENDPPLIATEHPQLDDNGDGRGSELQIDYLTIAQGGRADARRKRNIRKFADGQWAAQLALLSVKKQPTKLTGSEKDSE